MPATMTIVEANGAGQTLTDKTSGTIRYKKADNATVDLNNPLVVPTAATEYSFPKYLRMRITAGTFTEVSNLRCYTDGSSGYGTGIKLWFRPTDTYVQPAIPSTAQDPPQIAGGAMVDAFTYTSGSPLDIDAINTGPFDSTALPKSIGDYVVSVLEVEIGATQGVKSAEAITMLWDEI